MSLNIWGSPSTRSYETGIDRGVFYSNTGIAVPWNGLISVSEKSFGEEQAFIYIDGERRRNNVSLGSFEASIEAYTYPSEIESNQKFNFSYRTLIGTTLDSEKQDYKLHIVYNALATPTDKDYSTVNDSAEPLVFNWDISTTPLKLTNARASAHFVIDTRVAYPWALEAIEDILYGSDTTEAYLPSLGELLAIFEDSSILKITDHGDGTWTAEGSDEIIQMLDATTFQISWPSAVYINEETYQISSL